MSGSHWESVEHSPAALWRDCRDEALKCFHMSEISATAAHPHPPCPSLGWIRMGFLLVFDATVEVARGTIML